MMKSMALQRWVATVAAALTVTAAVAVIKPPTSVNAGKYMETVLQMEATSKGPGAPLALGAKDAAGTKVVQGEFPAVLEVTSGGAATDARLRAGLGEGATGTVQVFLGEYWGKPALGSREPWLGGALRAGSEWFALERKLPGKYVLSEAKPDFGLVWSAGDRALDEAVAHALANAEKDAAKWGADVKVTAIKGEVTGLQAVDVQGDGKPALFMQATDGDRVFLPATEGAMAEGSAALGLTTKSRRAAWADFTGDGRVDLLSWDGARMALYPMGADGRLPRDPAAAQARTDCLTLAAAAGPEPGRALVFVCAAKGAAVFTPGGDGTFSAKSFELPAQARVAAAQLLAGVAADFNGDGKMDYALVWTRGVLYFAGEADGGWTAAAVETSSVMPAGTTGAQAVDMDGDGVLDLVVESPIGLSVFRQEKGGTFRLAVRSVGLAPQKDVTVAGTAVFDGNDDGCLDLMLLYKGLAPATVLNRGFPSFTQSVNLGVEAVDIDPLKPDVRKVDWQMKCAADLNAGQTAACAWDWNGDGSDDMAIAGKAGQIWVLYSDPGAPRRFVATVSAPAGVVTPVTVAAMDGERSLGARMVSLAAPRSFAKTRKGPMRLEWTVPGKDGKQTKATDPIMRPVKVAL